MCVYFLASSVLRMIFNAFERDIVEVVVRDYLKKYQNGTVTPTDLWKTFDPYVSIVIDTHRVSVEDVMNTWTNQPGYPVVHAELNDDKLTLTQVHHYVQYYIIIVKRVS